MTHHQPMDDRSGRTARPPAPPTHGPEWERDDEIDLACLFHILTTGKWWIIACVAAALVCAAFYLFAVQPTYRADALLQIQSEGSSALQGLMQIKELTGDASTPAEAEIFIIKSRAVLGQVVRKLGLDVQAAPDYFPVVGESIAKLGRAGQPNQTAVPPDQGSWLSHYAWQPADIDVERFVVPESLHDEEFTLRALGGQQFVLLGPDGETVLAGGVGSVASGHTADGQEVKLFVAGLQAANPPTDFSLTRAPWLPVVDALTQRLEVAGKGDETGVIGISLEGEDPHKITTIVNAVAQVYLRQNVEARSQQAQQSLAFLDQQLPELQAQLAVAENELAEYREKHQAIGLDAEAQSLLQQVVSIEEKHAQLRIELAQLQQLYTAEHPKVKAAHSQLQSLDAVRQQLEERIDTLPASQKSILRLHRDVEVTTQLYTALLNRAQELRVVKAGTVGDARIIDEAVPPVRPVAPKTNLVLALALVLGFMFGCGLVFLRAALRHTVDDPKQIESALGLPVYAVIPHNPWLARQSRRAQRNADLLLYPILAREIPQDKTTEALRSLRTSLFFAQLESGSSVLMFSGPTAGVGKSFVSINLAFLLADIGKRVVVVDGDMRKGHLHRVMGNERAPGLSQVLAGQLPLDQALRRLDGTEVHILTTGLIPPNPSELLMRPSWPALIDQLKQSHDIVIIDAPPVLPVTDAAIAAAALPSVTAFMVVSAGAHPLPELEEAVLRMARHGRRFAGVVVNGLKKTHGGHAGAYSYYKYEYKSAAS